MRQKTLLSGGCALVPLLMAVILLGFGQQVRAADSPQSPKTVTGSVVDVESNPIVGVVVTSTGSGNAGTITDAAGQFSIRASASDVLVFSLVGYQPLEIAVGDKSHVAVVLREATQVIEDVVVVGFGTQSKVSVTGAVSSVAVPELLSVPSATLSNTLGGQMPGLIVRQQSGEPGFDGASIWIRGMATFNDKAPLILVDGIPRELDLVNPHDIESFSILKDASATAVYGMQGANGVVLITTKKGRMSKPSVTYRGEAAFLTGMRFPDYIEGYEFATLMNEASANTQQPIPWTDEQIQVFRDGSDPYRYPNVDWTDAVFKKHTWQTVHNLSVSGGAEVARYYLNLGLTAKDGLYQEDRSKPWRTNGGKLRMYNFRSNVDVNLAKSLVLDLGLAVNLQDRGYQGTSSQAIYNATRETSPIAYPIFNPDGSIGVGGPTDYLMGNPWALTTQSGFSQMFISNLQGNVGLKWDLGKLVTKGLTLSGKYSFDHRYFNEVFRNQAFEAKQYMGDDENGFPWYNLYREEGTMGYRISQNSQYQQYFEATLNYDNVFGRHRVNGMLVAYRRENKDLTAGSSTFNIPNRHQGLAARATYSYDDRYLVEFNAGYNGSEQFPKERRYGFFPSASLGWVVSNEEFFRNDVVTHLKLRGSYGQVGSDQTAGQRFLYISAVNKSAGTDYPFGRNQGWMDSIEEYKFGVPLKWEVSTKYNFGIDLDLFNSLTIQAEIFKERRDDQLRIRSSIPQYAGLVPHGIPYGNVARIDNKGFDGSIEYKKTTSSGLYFSFRGNFTFARNTIIEDDSAAPAEPYQNSRGTRLNMVYGLISEGLFQSQEEIDNWAVSTLSSTIRPGDIKYRDMNEDGVIDADDYTWIGNPNIPEIMYGFGGTVAYKGFDATVHFSGTANRDVLLDGTGMWPFNLGYPSYNVFREYYDNRFIMGADDNSKAKYPSPIAGRNTHNYVVSTQYLVSGSYLKLQNAEIGYTLPTRVTDRLKIGKMRVFVNGTNLAIFDKLKMRDPEQDIGTPYPQQRVINVGLQVNFK